MLREDYMEKCTECGEMIPFRIDDREIMPCPLCGSTGRTEVEIKEKICFKAKPYGTTGRKELEITLGDDFNRAEKKWTKSKRVIDRGHNYYEERVVDPMTGETLCSNQEALSSHIGHGYDKKNTRNVQR